MRWRIRLAVFMQAGKRDKDTARLMRSKAAILQF